MQDSLLDRGVLGLLEQRLKRHVIFIPADEREGAIDFRMREFIKENDQLKAKVEKMQKDYDDALKDGRKLGYETGLQQLAEDYISVKELKEMSLTDVFPRLEFYQ